MATKRKNFKNLLVASSSGPLPNTSNYGPGVEISPMLWVLGFHIDIKKEIFKNLLVPKVRARAFTFGM